MRRRTTPWAPPSSLERHDTGRGFQPGLELSHVPGSEPEIYSGSSEAVSIAEALAAASEAA